MARQGCVLHLLEGCLLNIGFPFIRKETNNCGSTNVYVLGYNLLEEQ